MCSTSAAADSKWLACLITSAIRARSTDAVLRQRKGALAKRKRSPASSSFGAVVRSVLSAPGDAASVAGIDVMAPDCGGTRGWVMLVRSDDYRYRRRKTGDAWRTSPP